MILSASRRTDIPCYYSEWFMNRVKEGYALVKNPMNPAQVSRVPIIPEKTDCIVFWTKDPANMMDKLPQLAQMGFHFYFQFTLTPYDHEIEKNLRSKREIIRTFRKLSDRIGKERVLWRYDPVLINDRLTVDYHINKFTEFCRELQGYTHICTVSFVDIYSKLSRQEKAGLIREMGEAEMHGIASGFSSIGREYGIELRACCEKLDLRGDGIHPAACIDKDIVEHILGHSIDAGKDKNQRIGCGCIKSMDIGIYNTCKNGCIYCYANYSEASIHRNYRSHIPTSPILIGDVNKDWVIIERKL